MALLRVCLGWLLLTRIAVAGDFQYAQPYFERVGSLDAIPSSIVTTMTATPDGLLWVGTQIGLLRYDGYRFEHLQREYRNPNSLPGNHVTALTTSEDGLLWIGTANDGLSIYDPNRGEFVNHRSDPAGSGVKQGKLSQDSIAALAVEGQKVWIGTGDGLSVFERGTRQFSDLPLPRPATLLAPIRVRSLLVDRDRTLWIGASTGLLRLRTGAGLVEPFRSVGDASEPFAEHAINALYQAQDGAIWVGTREHGVARISGPEQRLQRLSTQLPEGGKHLATDRIQSLLQVSSEQMWVATTVGLYALDAQTLSIKQHWLSDKSVVGSLAFDALGALLRAPSGAVWVGTHGGGLQRVLASSQVFRSIRLDTEGTGGLSFADVHAVLERADGKLWVGTGGNGIDILDPLLGRIGGFRPKPGDPQALGDGVVVALAETFDGAVWAGTQRGGLFRIAPDGIGISAVRGPKTVSTLLPTGDGRLWLGTSEGVLRLHTDSLATEAMLDTDERPLLGQIQPMLEDRQGRMWVGTSAGLRVLHAGEARLRVIQHEPGRADSLVHNTIYGLLEDRDGALWVATEQGLDRLRSWDGKTASFAHVSAELGEPNREVGANLLQDARGRIWTNTSVFDLAAKTRTELSRADGVDIGTSWFGAHGRLRDGRFLSGGTEGLLLITPDAYEPWTYQPPVVATELRINGLLAPLSMAKDGLSLSTDQRSFSLEFAALDYSAPQSNRYAYQLVGFDDDWIATGAEQRRASYSNLWPGTYQLRVRGSNRIGLWSPQLLQLTVRVLPRFWQTGWFAVSATFAVLSLLALGWRWRTHRLRERSKALDALVQTRTEDLQASNAMLQQANEGLKQTQQRLQQTQTQLVFQEKMASLGSLVAGVAHEVNTPLGIAITAGTFLAQRVQHLQRDLSAGAVRKRELDQYLEDAVQSTQLLVGHLDRAASLVRQFKQLSVDHAHDERRQVDLDVFMRDLLRGLEPLFKERAIALDYRSAPELRVDTYVGAISQVLTNLVQNALIHAFEQADQGRISVELESCVVATGKPGVLLRVCDNGLGMDAATLARAFEPFFTTKRNRGGTGLGLHIVFNVVRATLCGEVELSSQPGQGTICSVRFPAQAPERETAPI